MFARCLPILRLGGGISFAQGETFRRAWFYPISFEGFSFVSATMYNSRVHLLPFRMDRR